MRTVEVAGQLERLASMPGVRLVVAASAHEGLVVHAAGEETSDAQAVAALFAAVVRRAAGASDVEGRGTPRLVLVRAGGDYVLATTVDSLVVVVVSRPGANVGRVRLELLRAAEATR